VKTARATAEAFVKDALTAEPRVTGVADEGEQQREIAVEIRDPRTSQAAREPIRRNTIA